MLLTRKTALAAAALTAVLAGGTPTAQAANVHSATAPGRALAEASPGGRSATVAAFLRQRGASAATLASLRETGLRNAAGGIVQLRLQQEVDGLVVHGSYVKAAYDAQGRLIHVIDQLAPAGAVRAASIGEGEALAAAMAQLHPQQARSYAAKARNGNTTVFAGGSFFHRDPNVTRVAVPNEAGGLDTGFLVQTWTQQGNLLHHTLVGGNGRVLDVELRTNTDSYNVFVEDPGKNAQAIVAGPGAGNAQSPSGWLGSGAQTTVNITGNNVQAYLDGDANNAPDAGGSSVTTGQFTTAADLAATPTTTGNKAVSVQNLFYLNNVLHDRLYSLGFDEANGNFQTNNFGKGGAGNDAVLAEAQDGSGTDNANFATPPDGQKPRMQMYLFTGAGGTHEVAIAGGSTYNAAGAQFGPALNTTGLSGSIARATPADGCTAVSTAVSGKLALIDRGTCDFVTKVLNAQNAGATGVIVANNNTAAPDEVFTMGGTNRRIRIPAVMVGYNSGNAIKALGSPSGAMRLKSAQPLQLDAALDSDIVFHEYGHGLTWRMIGGMSGPLAGAIGEGASDVVAMLMTGDDRVGEYSVSNPLGIRRAPSSGYPNTYANVTGGEVHDDGEIYAAAMWRVIELYQGSGRSTDLVFRDFVDGMNYTPSTPAFEDMRNGMLDSIAASGSDTARCALVWDAFAQYGIGVGARGVVAKSGRVTITPSFTTATTCVH